MPEHIDEANYLLVFKQGATIVHLEMHHRKNWDFKRFVSPLSPERSIFSVEYRPHPRVPNAQFALALL